MEGQLSFKFGFRQLTIIYVKAKNENQNGKIKKTMTIIV